MAVISLSALQTFSYLTVRTQQWSKYHYVFYLTNVKTWDIKSTQTTSVRPNDLSQSKTSSMQTPLDQQIEYHEHPPLQRLIPSWTLPPHTICTAFNFK